MVLPGASGPDASTLAPPRTSAPSRERLVALDGLRGIAALSVLVFHYTFRSAQLFPRLGAPWAPGSWGYYGVALFFVISGFVIFLSLQGSSPRRFVLSRAIRLYPIYWVAAILTFAVVTAVRLPGRQVTPLQALANLPLVEQLWGGAMIDPVYWTLAIEGVFYLVVGVLYFSGALRGRALPVTLLLWLVVVTAIGGTARVLGLAVGQGFAAGFLLAVDWMPLFVLGICFYLLWSGTLRLVVGITAALAIVAAMLTLSDPRLTVVLPMIGALMAVALWGPQHLLGNRALSHLGEVSYPLYLTHQNLGYVVLLLLASLNLPRLVGITLTGVVALLLATTLTFLVDRPLRRFLRRRLLQIDTVE